MINFTPPAAAVKNVFLRMRVIGDIDNGVPVCGPMAYGQTEDYSVRISSSLNTTEIIKTDEDFIVFVKGENSIKLFNSNNKAGFGAYQIFDMSGKLIQKGKANLNIKSEQESPRGSYIINYQNTSKKYIN